MSVESSKKQVWVLLGEPAAPPQRRMTPPQLLLHRERQQKPRTCLWHVRLGTPATLTYGRDNSPRGRWGRLQGTGRFRSKEAGLQGWLEVEGWEPREEGSRSTGRSHCWRRLTKSKAPFDLRRWHCSCSLKHTMAESQSLGKPLPGACYQACDIDLVIAKNKSNSILDVLL